jgi:D-alanine-D-alanine ligase
VTGQRKIRVAVVFGGRSTEHAVSCASAGLVLSAIDPERYEVLPIGIATDGRWVLTSGDPARLALSSARAPSVEAVAVPGAEITPRPGAALEVTAPGAVPRDLGEVDVVLPLLHGTFGEDGTLQGLLEMTGTRYAGAGVFASAAGMDKEYMKLIIAARGLPVGRYVVVHDRDWSSGLVERKRVLDEIAELGWPVFVKPARGGSSIGISRVLSLGELESAVLEGLDGGPPEASVPGQVVVDPGSAFYDFTAKYLASGTSMTIPAPLPAAALAEVRRLACAAFDAISCEGLARVDFFCTAAGQILVNEINTMPGMTPASGFPMMWAASGLPLPQLVDRIIQTALRKRSGPRLPARRRQAGGRPADSWRPPALLSEVPLLLLLARLLAVDQGLEVGAGPEPGHRGLRHLDGGPGGRVTGRAGRPLGLLEHAEPGDGDLVAVGDGRLDGLEHRVHGFGRGLLVPQPTRDGVDQITLVHVHSCASPHRSRGRRYEGARPLTCPKVGDPAPLHNNIGQIGARVGQDSPARPAAALRKVATRPLSAHSRCRAPGCTGVRSGRRSLNRVGGLGGAERAPGAGGLFEVGQAVTGSQEGRECSKAVISSTWRSVRPMSSRPSIRRHRV